MEEKKNREFIEAMFISDARRLNMQTGRIHQLFGSMNEKAYTTWPMMKHCKILLPVGWVLLYIRRVYRVLTGKRAKMNYFKVYKDSYQREKSCINNCIFLNDKFPQSCVKVWLGNIFYTNLTIS